MITVAGSTGALGLQICRELLGRGGSVKALSRDPSSARAALLRGAGAEVASCDLENGTDLDAAVAGSSCVVSTATSFPVDRRVEAIDLLDRAGNLALVEACVAAGVPRVVFISFRPVPLSFPLQDAKRAVETGLYEAPLEALILRPGKYMDIWFSPLCGFDVTARRATLFGDGTSMLTWVSTRDVAEIAARTALGEGFTEGTVEIGGPEPLSQRDVIAIYERVVNAPFAVEQIPADELERALAEEPHPADSSLAALMLEAHCGAVTDMSPVLDALPIELESVHDFARRTAVAS